MSRTSIIAIGLLLLTVNAYADEGVCSTASLINPYGLDGGISGAGAPANGGIAGTGAPVAKGGVSGTGSPIAAGGVAGTGSPVAKGGVSGTGSKVAGGGVAGTGAKVAAGGVAGTGAPVAKGGGIGGTGDSMPEYALLPEDAQGDIGIMGVVTGFASICVNGEEVNYEDATPIYDNGKTAKLADLAVGKTVMLKVDMVNGNLHARAIGLFNAVTGPVSDINVTRQEITVMGQTVQVSRNTIRQLMLADATNSAVVSVSGYRANGGTVIASRVDLVNVSSGANTLGLVTGLVREGFVVNGTKVIVTNRQTLTKVKVGSEVQVSGSWTNGALNANHVEAQPINNVVSRVNSAIMEGYVQRDSQNHVSISGTEVSSSQDDSFATQVDGFKDKLVKVELRRDNKGNWKTEKVSERKGKRIDNEIQFNDNNGTSGGNSGKEGSSSGSSGSGGQGSSGSGSSGPSENSGHGSINSGSSSDHGGSSGGSSGGSGGSSGGSSGGHGNSGGTSGSSSRSGGGSSGGSSGSSSGGGSSGGSGGSSSGKYK